MAPCKRQVKATRHLICGNCSNWGTSSSPGVRSPTCCGNGGKGTGGLSSGFNGGIVDDKVGEDDERDARES